MHYLIALDTTVMIPGPNFYDEDGYDIHALNMISIVHFVEEETPISNLLVDEVSIKDVLIEQIGRGEEKSELTHESSNEED